MKLYATTTSERATKGQGGNDFLDIKIYIEDKIIQKYNLHIQKTDKEGIYHLMLTDIENTNILYALKTKGKSQKGEKEQDMSLGEGLNHFNADMTCGF